MVVYIKLDQNYYPDRHSMSSRHTQHQEEQSDRSNSFYLPDTQQPLVSKIEEAHLRNTEQIILMLVDTIKKLVAAIEEEDIIITQKIVNPRIIVAIRDASNQMKYHQKINPNMVHPSSKSVSEELQQVIQLLAKLKIHTNDVPLPKVKRIDELRNSRLASQLSTIVQKESQQNLLHNYLAKGGHSKRSRSNVNKNFIYTSSIEDLEFQVIRQQTRKSLDNPYHKNNGNRKGLYNDLQKLKGQDNLLPAVKSYLEKHRKHFDAKSKLAPYQIQKFI